MKPKVPSQSQHLASNRILSYIKIIVLLCQILGRLLHDFGHILIIINFWIKVGCICNHTIFNILLCTQVVFHKDRLAIIWSKKILIAAKRVRRTWRKIQNIYSRGGVPQAYLTPKSCNICACYFRLQRLRKQEKIEQQVEVEPTKPVGMKKIWRLKKIVSSSTWSEPRHGR